MQLNPCSVPSLLSLYSELSPPPVSDVFNFTALHVRVLKPDWVRLVLNRTNRWGLFVFRDLQLAHVSIDSYKTTTIAGSAWAIAPWDGGRLKVLLTTRISTRSRSDGAWRHGGPSMGEYICHKWATPWTDIQICVPTLPSCWRGVLFTLWCCVVMPTVLTGAWTNLCKKNKKRQPHCPGNSKSLLWQFTWTPRCPKR